MLNDSELKKLLSRQDLSRKTKILVILAANQSSIKTVSEIKSIAESNGLREIKKWNVSQIVGTAEGMVVRLPNGWEITDSGIEFLVEQEIISNSPTKQHQSDLRIYASAIQSEQTRTFIDECVLALEVGLLRSAVTLSWAGAISILHEEVVANHLVQFNAELQRRNSRNRQINTLDDLAMLKEYDFLQIINAISLIGKNVKQELEQCLQLRNACAHPNSLAIGERRVSSHLEILILNVYQKFII